MIKQNLSFQYVSATSKLWTQVKTLRLSVFVDEMDVPFEMEIDEYDKTAIHLCVKSSDKNAMCEDDLLLGTLRLVVNKHQVKMGRVAIHMNYRRKGIGTQMMREAINYCQQLHIQRINLAAQTYITPFYESLGFKQVGDIFDDAGIPHIGMFLELSDV